jgi:hypothetical protein
MAADTKCAVGGDLQRVRNVVPKWEISLKKYRGDKAELRADAKDQEAAGTRQ